MAGAALCANEREEIRVGIEAKESLSGIARRLDRDPSTVTREVKRNGGRARYCATKAESRCQRELRRPKLTTFQKNGRSRATSSSACARRTRRAPSPSSSLARGGIGGDVTSPESIYQAVYAHGAKGLASGLGRHLHRKRGRRKRRCRAGEASTKPSALGHFNLIHARPSIASKRTEVGHFEGDLIIGANNASAIVTIVDRASRFNLTGDLPGGHCAENVLACCIELFERVPEELRRTLTWDQGTEMARHEDLAAATGLEVFFADPHSPWQRPSNEHFNGTAPSLRRQGHGPVGLLSKGPRQDQPPHQHDAEEDLQLGVSC